MHVTGGMPVLSKHTQDIFRNHNIISQNLLAIRYHGSARKGYCLIGVPETPLLTPC